MEESSQWEETEGGSWRTGLVPSREKSSTVSPQEGQRSFTFFAGDHSWSNKNRKDKRDKKETPVLRRRRKHASHTEIQFVLRNLAQEPNEKGICAQLTYLATYGYITVTKFTDSQAHTPNRPQHHSAGYTDWANQSPFVFWSILLAFLTKMTDWLWLSLEILLRGLIGFWVLDTLYHWLQIQALQSNIRCRL